MAAISQHSAGKRCPFNRVVVGEDLPGSAPQSDVVWRDATVAAFVCSAWWPQKARQLLIVPNAHAKHVCAIQAVDLAAVQLAGKRLALTLWPTYGCDGTALTKSADNPERPSALLEQCRVATWHPKVLRRTAVGPSTRECEFGLPGCSTFPFRSAFAGLASLLMEPRSW